MIAAVCGGVRVVSIYAPNGRTVDSIYLPREARLVSSACSSGWSRRAARRAAASSAATSTSRRRTPTSGIPRAATAARTSRRPSGRRSRELCGWGLVDAYRRLHPERERYSWWDYRAGMFHKNFGMRIDHLLVTQPVAERVVWAEIDREARKGKPIPSDHAPVIIDLDEPGRAIDAGWEGAAARIAARRTR